jgi:hypothetical protein
MELDDDAVQGIIKIIDGLRESLNSFLRPEGSQIPDTTHVRRLIAAGEVSAALQCFDDFATKINFDIDDLVKLIPSESDVEPDIPRG